MKIRIKENIDNLVPKYAVLFTSDNLNGKNSLAILDTKDDAFSFYNDAEVMGTDVFKIWDPDIMTTKYGYKPDANGKCYYAATTPEGEEYLQEVRVVNQEPLYF